MFANSTAFPGTSCRSFWRSSLHRQFLWKPAVHLITGLDNVDDVKLLPPSYVRPYVHRSKTDRADVKGMLEAWRNSDIRPVPVKTESQQQLTALHRVRSTWIGTRTARINAVRGTLREFGIVIPIGASRVVPTVIGLIEDADSDLPTVGISCTNL
jgi:hypothetical protein